MAGERYHADKHAPGIAKYWKCGEPKLLGTAQSIQEVPVHPRRCHTTYNTWLIHYTFIIDNFRTRCGCGSSCCIRLPLVQERRSVAEAGTPCFGNGTIKGRAGDFETTLPIG